MKKHDYVYNNIWNLQRDSSNKEIDVYAEEDDIAFHIGGILFLIQTKNGYNNVVCKRVSPSKMTFRDVVAEFQEIMEECELQYIRVEGNTKRYKFLTKMLPLLFGDKVGILKDDVIDNRNVFYIKCY